MKTNPSSLLFLLAAIVTLGVSSVMGQSLVGDPNRPAEGGASQPTLIDMNRGQRPADSTIVIPALRDGDALITDPNEILRRIDTNQDGVISREEFQRLMDNNAAAPAASSNMVVPSAGTAANIPAASPSAVTAPTPPPPAPVPTVPATGPRPASTGNSTSNVGKPADPY